MALVLVVLVQPVVVCFGVREGEEEIAGVDRVLEVLVDGALRLGTEQPDRKCPGLHATKAGVPSASLTKVQVLSSQMCLCLGSTFAAYQRLHWFFSYLVVVCCADIVTTRPTRQIKHVCDARVI